VLFHQTKDNITSGRNYQNRCHGSEVLHVNVWINYVIIRNTTPFPTAYYYLFKKMHLFTCCIKVHFPLSSDLTFNMWLHELFYGLSSEFSSLIHEEWPKYYFQIVFLQLTSILTSGMILQRKTLISWPERVRFLSNEASAG
jgi:hypothetical protein